MYLEETTHSSRDLVGVRIADGTVDPFNAVLFALDGPILLRKGA